MLSVDLSVVEVVPIDTRNSFLVVKKFNCDGRIHLELGPGVWDEQNQLVFRSRRLHRELGAVGLERSDRRIRIRTGNADGHCNWRGQINVFPVEFTANCELNLSVGCCSQCSQKSISLQSDRLLAGIVYFFVSVLSAEPPEIFVELQTFNPKILFIVPTSYTSTNVDQ